MDKRIMTELLLIARAIDTTNQAKVIIALVEIFDILDSAVAIEAQKRDTNLTIVETEANLIWMKTYWLLINEGIKLGNMNSYAHHLDRTSYNTGRAVLPPIYLTNVN